MTRSISPAYRRATWLLAALTMAAIAPLNAQGTPPPVTDSVLAEFGRLFK